MNEGPDRLTYLRPEVQEFAEEMERRLREKDAGMGGNSWKGVAPVILLTYLLEHDSKLVSAVNLNNKEKIKKKTVDAANLAMMIWDVSK
jgi:hypothetical protein